LTLDAVKAARHGIDLGPLQPRGQSVVRTRDRRVKLCPPLFARDVERLRSVLTVSADATHPLLLVSRRTLKSMNSWLNNNPRLVKGRPRCTLLVHPDDAASVGVASDQPVQLVSRIGAIVVPAEISDQIMPGVVSLPFGWGHMREGARLSVAARHPGVSMNDVTDERLVDAVSGTSVLDGIPVRVESTAVVAPTSP
jgi:anaerobic selenocysteine-containing dehydrogenase